MWMLTIFLGLFSLDVAAKKLELKKNDKSIFIQEKDGWLISEDLFGIPFIYFSPEKNGQRSNISFSETGAEIEINSKSLSSTQEKYRKVKNEWAKKTGAIVKSFIPYDVSSNKLGHKIHKIGFIYVHLDKSYSEKSFYIECRGRILFSKSLRSSENEIHEKDFDDLIDSVDCGGI